MLVPVEVCDQTVMLHFYLGVDPVNLVYAVFEPQAKRDLLVESLLGLFEFLHQDFLLIAQVLVFLLQVFNLFVDLRIFILIDLLVVLDHPLPLFDFLAQALHLAGFVPFNLGDHHFEASLGAVLE